MTSIFNGTINLNIEPRMFQIINPDHEVTCTWAKNVTETFWFVQTIICYRSKNYEGYIYYPCPSPVKSHKDNIIELLSEKIPNIEYEKPLSIKVSSKQIQLR